MSKRLFALLLGFGLVAAIFMTVQRVHATLGETEDTVVADEKAVSAHGVSKAISNGYTVKQIDSDAVSLREYISPTGVIFAIAWNGLTHPDLTPLLGAYATEYDESLRHASRKPGRRHLRVETNRIVVEKWGQMRNLQGRAYVPALIPDGVTVDKIR